MFATPQVVFGLCRCCRCDKSHGRLPPIHFQASVALHALGAFYGVGLALCCTLYCCCVSQGNAFCVLQGNAFSLLSSAGLQALHVHCAVAACHTCYVVRAAGPACGRVWQAVRVEDCCCVSRSCRASTCRLCALPGCLYVCLCVAVDKRLLWPAAAAAAAAAAGCEWCVGQCSGELRRGLILA